MKYVSRFVIAIAALGIASLASAQAQSSTPMRGDFVEEVVVVSRTIPAVNFRRPGSVGTHLKLAGTDLAPAVESQVDVDAKEGYVQVQATTWGLPSAATFGDEYMTYVLWAITPEGRATNLGEFVVDEDRPAEKSRLEVTSELQTFGMIVTAEPHFAVTMPSNVVVLQSEITPGTDGKIEPVEAKFDLLRRGHYSFQGTSRGDLEAPSAPFYLIQARNARRISMDAGASKWAADSFQKAEALLTEAEDTKRQKDSLGLAKQAAQTFEDARIISDKKRGEEREAAALADAEKARREAELARGAAASALDQSQEADAARRAAEADADAARRAAAAAQSDADAARRDAMAAEQEQAALRAKLLQQIQLVFDTKETARGLIVSMPNVLFDFNRAVLRPEAREKLAKLAGIFLTTPGLTLAVEGHADAIGSDEYNQRLSEQRANAVRDYLVEQGVGGGTITSSGMGESQPIASNDTDEGRQQNRRVEIVVSGAIIGLGN